MRVAEKTFGLAQGMLHPTPTAGRDIADRENDGAPHRLVAGMFAGNLAATAITYGGAVLLACYVVQVAASSVIIFAPWPLRREPPVVLDSSNSTVHPTRPNLKPAALPRSPPWT